MKVPGFAAHFGYSFDGRLPKQLQMFMTQGGRAAWIQKAKHAENRRRACPATWCHSAVDGRTKTEFSRDELRLMHAEGAFRTIRELHR
jgi:hypothetical protein